MTGAGRQPWIHSPTADGLFILGPPLVATAIAAVVAAYGPTNDVPVWAWALLIIGVDVAHVYSTLFRTYLRPAAIRQRPALYALAPLLGWLLGVLLYSVSRMAFWRALAYLATFHFIRQQYGFMRIYARREHVSSLDRRLDAAAIYAATLYPLIYWHAHLPRRFQWFVSGDFIALPAVCAPLAGAAFLMILAAYAGKELRLMVAQHRINIPKNLLLLGTLVSWYVGIVVLDGDLTFTVTNVVSHGVPYLALIWILGRTELLHTPAAAGAWRPRTRVFFTHVGIPLFCAFLIGLAYVEEGLWDGLVWRDHAALFGVFQVFSVVDDRATLTWLVPLLALPQITHYVLDGFIWRLRRGGEASHTRWSERLSA